MTPSVLERALAQNRVDATIVGATTEEEMRSKLRADRCIVVLDLGARDQMKALEVLGRLRADTSFSHLPVLTIAKISDDDARERATQLGAVGYFTLSAVEDDEESASLALSFYTRLAILALTVDMGAPVGRSTVRRRRRR
jgi:PleD family two-component response regulator